MRGAVAGLPRARLRGRRWAGGFRLTAARGYGRSDPRPLPWTLDYMEQEAMAVPAVLAAAGIPRAVLVGHSDGATIALLAASEAGGGAVGADSWASSRWPRT